MIKVVENDGTVEALKLDELSYEEQCLVRRHRAEKESEAELIAAWKGPFAELNELVGEGDHKDFDRVAWLLVERLVNHGWGRDREVLDLTHSMMRFAGYERVEVLGHGPIWRDSLVSHAPGRPLCPSA